ncbi:MAG TPA: hypothetical protein VFR58_14325 [Flavisolibacter sp.]|nr:hypothetical protein [Flavisolibacter sp.]
MKRPQWIVAGIALLLTAGLYAATKNQILGAPPQKSKVQPIAAPALSIDSILYHAKENLTPEQSTRISLLEKSITRGDVVDQKLHVYHQLARFWADSARAFAPYAWYTAEAARLENSEKSLTFAAHLLLNNLVIENNPALKQWEALQAKDLFERSLKLNPGNDSSKIGLGAVYVYGGVAMPMEGISMIRSVADKDSTNIYAQMTLGMASLMSGQLEKAKDRFKAVARLQPTNLEAIFRVAETAERIGNKEEAIEWYRKGLSISDIPELKKEVEARIAKLKK